MKLRRKMLTDFVELHVIEGYLGPDELVEKTVLEFQEDIPREQLLPVAQRLVYQRIVKRYLEEINWVSPTDCERIDRAFLELNQMGIVAKQNFSCCNNCGHKRIDRAVRKAGKKAWGYAFFHSQDTDGAVATGELNITFGAVDKTSEKALEVSLQVGQKVAEVLERNGLKISWDGSYMQRIGITGIKWQRRRFPALVESQKATAPKALVSSANANVPNIRAIELPGRLENKALSVCFPAKG